MSLIREIPNSTFRSWRCYSTNSSSRGAVVDCFWAWKNRKFSTEEFSPLFSSVKEKHRLSSPLFFCLEGEGLAFPFSLKQKRGCIAKEQAVASPFFIIKENKALPLSGRSRGRSVLTSLIWIKKKSALSISWSTNWRRRMHAPILPPAAVFYLKKTDAFLKSDCLNLCYLWRKATLSLIRPFES